VQKLIAFGQFSRPHTVIGTSLSVTALFTIASSGDYIISLWLWALVSCLCGNIYIVGLNQLEDIEIDKINKPNLPLASGEFSKTEAWVIVVMAGFSAIAIALSQGVFLLATIISSLIIGTTYSLPPIRLKRFPFWASVCIFVVRGVIVNLGLFLHFNRQTNQNIPANVWLLTIFVLVFSYVIAIFKDLPDIEGDRQFNVATLSIRLGQAAVFNLSRQILAVLYVGMAIASFSGIVGGINSIFLASSHTLLAILMWWRSSSVDLSDRDAITDFYQFIWQLFYLEYIIFAIACIWT
jgi:homogentisate phytyltransferase / homogentisate geranylgeranyltransferase